MLADVNWKTYVCIKLFFLDLADMYNHIKMVLTHTHKHWITPNLLCNNKWKNVLISQLFQIQNVISWFKWHFSFQSSNFIPCLFTTSSFCSCTNCPHMFFEYSESWMVFLCIFLLKTWWSLILMFTGTLVQINSTFHTLIIVKYIFDQCSHKDISWEKCNFWILLFSLNRTK